MNLSIFAGLSFESCSSHARLSNKQKARKKGHVLVKISYVGVGPCGGGTSNITDATKHHVSTVLVLKCNTGNVLGSGSIRYVSAAYQICCMIVSKYFIRIEAVISCTNETCAMLPQCSQQVSLQNFTVTAWFVIKSHLASMINTPYLIDIIYRAYWVSQ